MHRISLVFAAIMVSVSGPALAMEAPVVAVPLTAEELGLQTGGLRTPTGIEIGFGATVKTYVNGDLVLQTQLNWTDNGAVQTTEKGVSGNAANAASASGVRADGLLDKGVFIAGENGGTGVIHDLTDSRIANLVFNTADNRNIRQETAINLTLPDLNGFQRDVLDQQTQLRLQDSVSRALSAAAK